VRIQPSPLRKLDRQTVEASSFEHAFSTGKFRRKISAYSPIGLIPGGVQEERSPIFSRMDTVAIGASTLRLGESLAKLIQRDLLQLANALPRYAKFLADLSEGLGLFPAESKARVDDLAFPVVEQIEQFSDFLQHVLIAKAFKRTLRVLIAEDVPQLERFFSLDRSIQGRGVNRNVF